MTTPKAEQQTPEFQALNADYSATREKLIEANRQFVQNHPHSFISLEIVAQIGGANIDYEKTAPLYNTLSTTLKQTPLGKKLGAAIAVAGKTKLGAVMPAFTSLDTARQPLELNTVVRNSKVTLVDFWASWCGPCRAENPNVVKAFNAFHDKGFNIISVSLDDNEASWKKAIVKDGMPWYHVSGLQKWKEPVAQFFGINGIPDNFLLDEKGRVVARGLKGEALYKKVAELTQKN